MAYYRLYKKSLYLLFIIFCTQHMQGTAYHVATPDTARTLWKQSKALKEEAEFILHQIENDTINRQDSLVIHEKIAAFSLLLEAKQLRADYYSVVIDSLNQSTPPKEDIRKLYQTIQTNADTQFNASLRRIENAQQLNIPDTILKAYQTAIQYQDRGLAGLKLMKAIHEVDESTKSFFGPPISVKKVAERYGIPESDINYLIKGVASSKKVEVAQADTVTKGYSPFTSETKDFYFEPDSIAKAHPEIPELSSEHQASTPVFEIDTALQRQLNTVWNQNFQYLQNDTLFTHAAQDSLFPHQMVSLYDKSSLKRYWAIYLNQWTELSRTEIPPTTSGNPIDTDQQLAKVDISKKHNTSNDIRVKEKFDSRQTTSNLSKDDSKSIAANPLLEPSTTNETLYFIQIAASRSPLTGEFILTFYKGGDSIYTRIEEDWYKYQIGKTASFSEALKTLNNTDVEGAFIVPYAGNEKLILWKTLRSKTTVIPNQVVSGLTFVVQIAASRDPLSGFQIKQLTKNTAGSIREIQEDQWYKYQLIVGSSYSEARKRWQQIGITKSFIVAYFNNEKIEMTEAFRKLKEN